MLPDVAHLDRLDSRYHKLAFLIIIDCVFQKILRGSESRIKNEENIHTVVLEELNNRSQNVLSTVQNYEGRAARFQDWSYETPN